MAYKYTHFIPQNIAPKGAKGLGVYDNSGKKICNIPLGGLNPPRGEKLYSFGLVSDVHLMNYNSSPVTTWRSEEKFPVALQYFIDNNCDFCAHCGDVVNEGFYHKNDSTGEIILQNDFHVYDTIRKQFNIPIYGCCGNHEHYGRNMTDTTPTTINGVTKTMLEWLYDYTVEDGTTGTAKLSYTLSHTDNEVIPESDLFIFVGQPKNIVPVGGENGEEGYEWLETTLEANKDKRCFIFLHSYMEEDSGDAGDVRENSIFNRYWGETKTTEFKNLLSRYPNIVLFHGHSHLKLENQELYDSSAPLDALQASYKAANYTDKNGFKSVHVPSCGYARDIVDGMSKDDFTAGQGYIVDVYDDCIVLNGWRFADTIYEKIECVPIGTYKISTEV